MIEWKTVRRMIRKALQVLEIALVVVAMIIVLLAYWLLS